MYWSAWCILNSHITCRGINRVIDLEHTKNNSFLEELFYVLGTNNRVPRGIKQKEEKNSHLLNKTEILLRLFGWLKTWTDCFCKSWLTERIQRRKNP